MEKEGIYIIIKSIKVTIMINLNVLKFLVHAEKKVLIHERDSFGGFE